MKLAHLTSAQLGRAQRNYGKYVKRAKRSHAPMPFEVWVQFHAWGKRGGAMSHGDKAAAGRKGAAAARRNIAAKLSKQPVNQNT